MTREDHSRFVEKIVKRGALLVLASVCILACAPAFATDWWVDGKYGSNGNSGSYSRPFKEFYRAMYRASPGDRIYLKPTITYPRISITKSGTASKPILISGGGGPGNPTKITGGGTGFGIWIGASYLTIANFDVTAPGVYSAIHAQEGEHHLTISYNVTHDAGGNGISMVGNDYVTISYNTVYGNAKNTTRNVFASGISVKAALDIDNYTGVKIRVNGNTVYANTNVPTCSSSECWAKVSNSDGNGIIIDNNRRTEYDNVWYRGRTIVSNNVVFGNGGRGIHVYLADHVSINGNTAYFNNQDPYEGNWRPGEIEVIYASDVSVYNNIMYSDGGTGRNNGMYTGTHLPVSVRYCGGLGQIIIRNNLGYRPQNDTNFFFGRYNEIPVDVSGNMWGNPGFVYPSLNPNVADFRVKPGSKALSHGLAQYAMENDILGVGRGSSITIGAYENAAR